MARLLRALTSAAWPITAVALACVAEWMVAFGPGFLVQGWIGVVLRMGLWLGALAAAGHGVLRHRGWIAVMSLILMVFALIVAMLGVNDWVLRSRGEVTDCTVRDVEERVVTERRGDGTTTSTTHYIHHLDCAATQVRTVTTPSSPSAEPGERVTVLYDPAQRLGPRLLREVVDPEAALQLCAIFVGLTILVRGGSELIDSDHDKREPDEPATAVLGGFAFDAAALAVGLLFLFLLVVALRIAGWVTDAVLDALGVGDTWLRPPLLVLSSVMLGALIAYLILVRGGRLLSRLLASIPHLSWSERTSRELLVEFCDFYFVRAMERRVKRWFHHRQSARQA